MAKYGFSTAIPYGTDIFEVTGVEFCQWEDALEASKGNADAMEWATYDVLINNGYFVNAPTVPRPSPEPIGEVKPPAGQKKRTKTQAGDSSPGIRDIPDGFNLIDGRSREPVWTQSRILTERNKLLQERERIHALKEKALEQKILQQQILERVKLEEGTSKTSVSDIFYIMVGGFVLFLFLLITAISMSQGK